MDASNIKKVWTRIYSILPLEDAVVVDLVYGHGMSQKAAAEKLNREFTGVSKALSRALKRLREDSELKSVWTKEVL